MIIPTTVDYDRLHAVIESINAGQPTPRRAGRTFAFMHLMVGEMHLGDFNNVYMYVAPSYNTARHTMMEFVEYAKSMYGPDVFESINQSTLTLVTTHHQRYMFVGNRDALSLPYHMYGSKVDRAFIDVTPHDSWWLRELYVRIKAGGGDVLF
jgi:hypothetical protein